MRRCTRGANAARIEAERRFSEVRALANYMLFDLDSRLETTPGTTQARREMVGRSQQYLDALGETAGDNLELQREVAVGLARLAEVQGVPGKAHVGEPARPRRISSAPSDCCVSLDARAAGSAATFSAISGRVRYLLALVYGGQDNDSDAPASEGAGSPSSICLRLSPPSIHGGPRPPRSASCTC